MNECPRNLKHRCEIDGCYLKTLWDWGWLNDCFGGSRIRPSDIDGVVEHKGRLLILEGKREGLSGRVLSKGQRIMFEQVSGQLGALVLVLYGDPPRTPRYLCQWLPGGRYVDERQCGADEVRAIVHRWYRWVDGYTGKRTHIENVMRGEL